ncbi:hypothetical protein GQ44DRAFT_706201 [Phaeosphaeriaceae sp. PMI808]|nr:hypothetical protein GQ44DRAFT_706201 [Phaeosphaeriaceae sp. PMI808]
MDASVLLSSCSICILDAAAAPGFAGHCVSGVRSHFEVYDNSGHDDGYSGRGMGWGDWAARCPGRCLVIRAVGSWQLGTWVETTNRHDAVGTRVLLARW